jgi:hypothetical protein
VASFSTCPAGSLTLVGNLDADVQARIRELREEREQLAAELGKVKLEREAFAADLRSLV